MSATLFVPCGTIWRILIAYWFIQQVCQYDAKGFLLCPNIRWICYTQSRGNSAVISDLDDYCFQDWVFCQQRRVSWWLQCGSLCDSYLSIPVMCREYSWLDFLRIVRHGNGNLHFDNLWMAGLWWLVVITDLRPYPLLENFCWSVYWWAMFPAIDKLLFSQQL